MSGRSFEDCRQGVLRYMQCNDGKRHYGYTGRELTDAVGDPGDYSPDWLVESLIVDGYILPRLHGGETYYSLNTHPGPPGSRPAHHIDNAREHSPHCLDIVSLQHGFDRHVRRAREANAGK